MADDRIFTLVGKFDDKITPSLAKLSKAVSGLTKDFEKMQGKLRPIAKDMAIMAEGANRISQGFRNQRSATDNAIRGLTEYRRELGKAASAQEKLQKRVKLPTFSGGSSTPSRPARGGRGGGGGGDDGGDGYTIAKGVIANLATNMITGIFDQIGSAVGKSVNFVKNALQERINDEMGDIQSAGGILSIGKDKKVAWADTFQEAMGIQNKLNSEMANLAASLPGETEQYVQNMKQITDTTMKVVQSNGPAMIKAMKGFNGSVVTQKDAYIEATKQLAKYTTLASIGNEGGMPLTALAEQMLNADRVNVGSLKMKFAALKKNPLVSGALEKYEAEMNKGAAGSAERYTAMIKAFEQAFPAEVLDAMTNSADGIIQGMKSSIFNPDIGLLGLGRKMKVSFEGLNRKMGPAMEELSVFDMFLKIFKAFGMVVSPILSELPKIIEVMDPLINPLKDFFVKAENTISNFKGATKMFGDKNLDFPAFRASLMSIGKLAKSMGGNEAEYEKLQTMLTGKKLNLGAALQQAFKVLFSSDALNKFGKSIGKALGGFLSMLSGLAGKGGKMVDQSGMVAGFLEGWKEANGTKAIIDLVKQIIETVVKAVISAIADVIKTDPIGAAALAAVFIAPVRGAIFKLFKFLATKIGTALAPETMKLGKMGMAKAAMGGAASQFGKAGALMPGAGALTKVASGAKMKGVGLLAAGAVKIATVSPQLAQAGKALMTVGKRIPLLSVALAGLDFAARKAEGQSTATAAGGAAGSVVGGVAGAAIGTAILPGIGTAIGGIAGSVIGDWVGAKLGPMLASLPATLSAAWAGITNWFSNLPYTIGFAIGQSIVFLNNAWATFTTWFAGLGPTLSTWIIRTLASLRGAWSMFVNGVKAVFSGQANWSGVLSALQSGFSGMINGFTGWMSGAWGNLTKGFRAGQVAANSATPAGKPPARRKWDGKGANSMPLHSAIASEMANKPAGSDLVIANSSETIIPAAGGLGSMDGFVSAIYGAAQNTANVFSTGFQNFSQKISAGQQATVAAINRSTQVSSVQNSAMLAKLSAQNAALMAKISASPAFAGGGAGGAMALGGGYGSRGSQIAGALGNYIKSTGGAPGSIHEHPQHGGVRGRHSKNSYHYQGRAIDIGAYAYEQGGVLARVAQFNAKMGVKPVELLKAGDPGHSDHVHVAYGMGAGNPAFFNSASAADKWESMMAGKNSIISSVRAQSQEMRGGGTMTVNAPITIHQQPGQDSDQLASLVAIKLTQAVNQLRYSSYNV